MQGSHGDSPVLIVHSDAPTNGFQCHARERSIHASIPFDISRGNRAIAIFGRQVTVDAICPDATKAGLRVGVSTDVGQRDGSIPGDGADPFRNVCRFNGSKGRLECDSSPDVAHSDFPVGRLRIERTVEILQFKVAKGIADGHGSSHQRARLNTAVVSRAVYARLHVGKRHVSEAVADVEGAGDGCNIDVPVIVVYGQIATNIFGVDVAKRSCDASRSGAIEGDCSIASRDGRAALNIAHRDAAEAVLHFESAFHVGNLNGAVFVVDDGVAGGAGQLNAAEGIVQTHRAGVLHSERAVAVFDVHSTVDSSDANATETVANIQRSICRQRDVITHGPRGIFADMKPFVFFRGVNRANTDAFSGLLNFNLNFLREGLGFVMRAGLGADDRGNFDLTAGFAVDFDLAEFVLDANGLARAESQGLVKIARDLVLWPVFRSQCRKCRD